MRRQTRHAVATPAAQPAATILEPGRNCWRVERADAFSCIQDAADYFALVRGALLEARDTVFILGWDIASSIDLAPGLDATDGAPTRLDELLAFVTRRRPRLRCYILVWDYGSLYTLEREPLTRWRLRLRTPRRVRIGFDDHHPIGASHHQKIVVVDDRLAFCGSIDLTMHRWDTSGHRLDEPSRKTFMGVAYDPYHEVQAMVSGPVAARLGELARDRWRAFGADDMPPLAGDRDGLWPSGVVADLTNVEVAISRTMPASETQPAIRECEALFLDSIARAQRQIYIENQYFTDHALAEALAARLAEPHGPEVVIVAPKECAGWLERQSMGAFRDAAFRHMADADRYGRLRLVYPIASRSREVPTFIHSKVMIVDDELVRIGSANCARRSMGMDSECDLAVEAGGVAGVRDGIRRIRDRLLAEHLGVDAATIATALTRTESLCALIDAHRDDDRCLTAITPITGEAAPPSVVLRDTIDPGEPMGFGATVAQLVPAVDATAGGSPLRLWILPAIALAAALATASVINHRPEFQTVRDVLAGTANLPSALWIGTAGFMAAGLLLVPLELLTIAAGLAFGGQRGMAVAALASLALAVIGYAAGRAIGAERVTRWVSRRSYRSVHQLGARGALGVIVLRMSNIASTGAIHLLCGAGRVPFVAYMIGTIVGVAPAVVVLATLGGWLREALLHPSIANALDTIALAVALLVAASVVRTVLLIRQFAPSLAGHRERAEFG